MVAMVVLKSGVMVLCTLLLLLLRDHQGFVDSCWRELWEGDSALNFVVVGAGDGRRRR